MKINSLISMGDVLPPRKQTVVERLKRRFGHYRQHQNACLPRYEQAASGLYETQRQDTLLLKQRYLESKAKKAKSKSDHHRTYKEPSSDASKTQSHSKSLKRSAEDALSNATPEPATNDDTEKPAKIQCTDPAADKPAIQKEIPLQQANQQQSSLSSFSVQIVQQFTQSPLNQPPQTIQTNVTVQALPKPLQSPVPPTPQSVAELSVPNSEDLLQTTAVSNIECKQEKETGDADLCQFKGNQAADNSVSSGGDRLSDTFPSIEFTDESGEQVLHPDILNDLIEDVFTNSADFKDFNFEDSVGSLKDQEEETKKIIETLKASSPAQLRPFHADSLSFATNSTGANQQNDLFKNIQSSSEVPGSTITSNTTASVTSSSPSFYNSAPQRLHSYNSSSLPLPNGLGLDFKLNEPSPAALTLKQLAEQHQNMQQKQQQQQQQLGSSPLNNRPQPFNQNTFASQMNSLRSNFLNGSNSTTIQNNSPKMLNSGTNMFNTFDQHLNNFQGSTESSTNFPTANCDTMSSNNVFGADVRSRPTDAESEVRALQMKLAGQPQQQKPPAYGTTRPLTHYASNSVRHQTPPVSGQLRPAGRQFQNNHDMRLQMSQVQQQIHPRQNNAQQLPPDTHDIKQQHTMMQQQQQQPHPNMYGNYPPQQSVGNPPFHPSMSQSMTYSSQFTTNSVMNRPPPEYKAAPHHRNDNLHIVEQLNAPSQVMFNQQTKNKYPKQQRAPNVTITPDGTAVSSTHDWRTNLINNQQPQFRAGPFNPQENYGDMNSNVPVSPNIPLSPIYNQFRMPGNQIPNNRTMARPNMGPPNHMLHQQRQRLNLPQQQQPMRNPSMDQQHASITMSNNAMNGSMMGPMYSEHQEIERQDGSHLSLDFLDNIESSASDLLNFDQVMQSGTHYPNLDDILGK